MKSSHQASRQPLLFRRVWVAVVYKKGMNMNIYSFCFLYVFFRGNYYSQRYWEISEFTIPKNDFLFNFLFSFLDIVTKLLFIIVVFFCTNDKDNDNKLYYFHYFA